MLNELKKIEGNIGNLKDAKARLEDREACHLRIGYKEIPGKTKGTIEEERKKDIINNLTQKYGNVTVGIHGQELPKFSSDETTKEWWRNRDTYNDEPLWTSAIELKEN